MKRYFGKMEAAHLLPRVKKTDNKYSRGRTLIFAGSEDFPGAGILSAQGAARMGCGYVTLAQKKLYPSLRNADFIFLDLNKKNWRDFQFDSVLIGPGFGVNDFTRDLIMEFKKRKFESVILDADAITACARYNLFPLPQSWILTPHVGELSRCIGVGAKEIQNQREHYLVEAQKNVGGVILLKGYGTLIANEHELFQIRSGNEALAKAGTGDVLSGIIASLRANGLGSTDAALLGAYVHGATANLWLSRKNDVLSMRAVDILDLLPRVLRTIRNLPAHQA